MQPFPHERASVRLAQSPERRSSRWVVPGAILLLSLVPRLPNLGAPLLERHDFRQTQTAITVQAYLDEGVDLFRPKTPVFGPPWQAPFEFPTFQLTAYAVAKAGVPLDLACRLAALAWFYLSAVLVFGACRRFVGERPAIAALVLYVASPFSVTWSRASLIDYASVALALGYLLALASFAARPRLASAAVALSLGSLAYLTKLTTVAAFAPALAIVVVDALRRVWRRRDASLARGAGVLASLAVLLGAPVAASVAWTRWTDAVKAAAPATQWITSHRLTGWMFGSLSQRLELARWTKILERVNWIVPGLLAITLAVALAAAVRRRTPTNVRLTAAAALAGVFLTIGTFFNVYWVHDYYLIAATPGLAAAAGIGIAEILSFMERRLPDHLTVQVTWRSVALGVAAVAALLTTFKPFRYARTAWWDTHDHPIFSLARVVAEVTPPDGWVVIEGDDWNPRIPYLSHRRAFMVRPPFVSPELVVGRPELATLVCFTCPADVLALWPERRKVAESGGAQVFTLRPAGPDAAAPR